MPRALAVLLLACLASPLTAQEPDPWRVGLPSGTARAIELLLSDSSTVRFQGNARIAAGDRIGGSVVAWSGTLTIAGDVGGQVVVLHGDLILEPGASVGGDVTVVDGAVSGLNAATVAGGVIEYREGFGRDARRRYADPDREGARSVIAVGIEGNYNRVEGMPLHFGPDLRTGGPASLRLQALAILRTEPGFFDTKAMGYRASLSQRIPHSGLSVEASAFSRLDPVESWSVSDLEATLGAMLLHDDFRDYYERTGWSAGLRFASGPVAARAEFAREEHESARLRDPWTLFRSDREWRLMPLAAEGDIDLLRATATVDLRRSERNAGGWFAEGRLIRGLSSDLAVTDRSETGFAGGVDLPPAPFNADFTVGLLDVRRYQELADGVFALRALAGGNLERAALPPQYQFSLGGIGSLPGYASFHADCGARSRILAVDESSAANGARLVFDRYGCDRIVMVQAEYRGGFGLRVGSGDRERDWDDGHDFGVRFEPDWVLFFDAGRGWGYGSGAASTRTLFDAGAGLLIGDFGLYGAVPLTGDERALRVFIRLGPRF